MNTQSQEVSANQDSKSQDSKGSERVDSLKLAMTALDAALEKKALEPVLLKVDGICSYADYILLLSGRSERQVDAVAEGIKAALRDLGYMAMGVEGKARGQWALLDYGDLIIHVFHHPVREHYDLESMWHEAENIEIEIPDEARISSEDSY